MATTVLGLVAEVGGLAHVKYQEGQSQAKIAEILKTHPKPNDEAIIQATQLIEEQNTHHDLPDRKVIWAQEQLNLKKDFDEEFAREFPHGTVPYAEIDKKVVYAGGAVGAASAIAWVMVRSRTRRELGRRDFLRSIAGLNSEMEQ